MDEDKSALLRSLEIGRSGKTTKASKQSSIAPRSGGIGKIVAGLVVLAVLGGGWIAWQRWEPGAAQATAPVAKQTVAQSVTPVPVPASDLVASGYVVARRKATVAAEITGKVTDVFVEEGMVVTEGQELARLDTILPQADLASAKARVVSAEASVESGYADLKDAERILERTRNLQAKDFATQADLTKNQARADVLRAQWRKAQADLATAKVDVTRSAETLDKHHIKAPFAGVVVDKNAQPGEMISPLSAGGGFTRTGVCTIVDMDSLEIEVDVNEAFIHKVTAQQHVNAVLDAYPDWVIPASVIAIVPTANRDKATIKVRIAILQKDPRILPDMAVKVTFLTPPADGSKLGASTVKEHG